MQTIEVTSEGELYANDVQDAIFEIMSSYAESVGFETQIAIMGVAVGAILDQLSEADREYFTRVFIHNMSGARELSTLLVTH